MPNKLQIRRGLRGSLPALSPGEFGFCTDTNELFIGSPAGNVKVATDLDAKNIKQTAIAGPNGEALSVEEALRSGNENINQLEVGKTNINHASTETKHGISSETHYGHYKFGMDTTKLSSEFYSGYAKGYSSNIPGFATCYGTTTAAFFEIWGYEVGTDKYVYAVGVRRPGLTPSYSVVANSSLTITNINDVGTTVIGGATNGGNVRLICRWKELL